MQTFLTLMFTKISICLFLLRIMVEKWLRRPVYTLIGVNVAFTATCVSLFWGICRPLNSYWTVGVDGKCLGKGQVERLIIAQGGRSSSHAMRLGLLNVLTMCVVFSASIDLILASFPIIILRSLQISFRTKIALCLLMGLGVMYVMTIVTRLIARPNAFADSSKSTVPQLVV